jgi:hypothetical protein
MSSDWINGRQNSPHRVVLPCLQTGSMDVKNSFHHHSLMLRLQRLMTENINVHKLTNEQFFPRLGTRSISTIHSPLLIWRKTMITSVRSTTHVIFIIFLNFLYTHTLMPSVHAYISHRYRFCCFSFVMFTPYDDK